MSWYELIWFALFPVILFGGIFLSCAFTHNGDPDGGAVIIFCLFWFLIGLVTSAFTSESHYKITAQFETKPTIVNLTDGGLDIVLDDYQHFHWVDYGMISKWKNGGKFYKVYSYDKEDFGPDNTKFELIIK